MVSLVELSFCFEILDLFLILLPNCFFAVAGYARSQGKTPVTFGPTDLVCCRTLQGHTGKVGFLIKFFLLFLLSLFLNIQRMPVRDF